MKSKLSAGIWMIAAGWALVGPTRGEIAASVNFVLQQNAFTVGNPNATNPASSRFTLQAMSLGGISHGAVTTTVRRLYSGYLVPLDLFFARPDLRSMVMHGGRVWLDWMQAAPGARYTVESAVGLNDFAPLVTGLTAHAWDAPVPATPALFYRVQAHPPP